MPDYKPSPVIGAVVASDMTLKKTQEKVKEMNDASNHQTVQNILGNLADHEQEVKKDEIKATGAAQKDSNVDVDTVDDYIN